ncbi:MAG: enterochelin esterase [Planctomyces sp.]|nr:enterochelin esterase [Planctomyces sp.]
MIERASAWTLPRAWTGLLLAAPLALLLAVSAVRAAAPVPPTAPVAPVAPVAPPAQATAEPGRQALATPVFSLTLDPSVQPGPYSGRLYVVLVATNGRDAQREPRLSMGNWFNGPQVLARDVEGLAPGTPATLDAGSLSFPAALSAVPPGRYHVQAVARRSPDSPKPGQGPGDAHSAVATVTLPLSEPLALSLDKVVAPPQFPETQSIRLVEVQSRLLTEFHGRPITIRAGVSLPEGHTGDGSARYPAVYFLTGFGGDHRGVANTARSFRSAAAAPGPDGSPAVGAPPMIFVVPDPLCFQGHSVFADSANNGPWARALVEELIPEVERRFAGPITGPDAGRHRYLTGVSSGGWASLWLQLTHPDFFGGVWSHVPDPVDFRDFQRIDLYADGANMYRDAQGERRPLARRQGQVSIYYQDFVSQETVLGPGGQIGSFEAVFSPRGADGRPVPLFDRATGRVDPEVAKAWERYDINLLVQRQWATLGPKVAGKIRVYAGEVDSFYLEGAAAKLKETMARLGSDAVIEVVPGMGHAIAPAGVLDMLRTIAANPPVAGPAPPIGGGAGR